MLKTAWRKLRQSPATLPLTALALLIAISYGPAFSADYIWDDEIFLTDAPALQAFTGLPDIWLNPRTIKKEAHYWPIVYSSFWLEYQLWGFNPIGSHIVNLLLHFAVCALLWQLLRQLAVPGAWLAAAIFALHPVHAEAAAWAIARKDLLASIFYLLAAGCWLRQFSTNSSRGRPTDSRGHSTGSRGRSRPAAGAYLALLGLFTAGMLSKSLMITFPAALLVLAWWERGRIEERELLLTAPLFLLGIVIAAADLAFYHARAVIDFTYPWAERPVIAAKALWFYAGKLLWPHPLIPIYPKWDTAADNWLNWLPLLAGLGLLSGLYLARHRIGRGPLAAALLYCIILSPTLGLFINVFMEFAFAADRYQYLASAAPIALLVAAAVKFGGAWGRVAALLLLAACGALTFRQTFIYQDNAAFWSYIIERNPAAHGGYYNLGLGLVAAGRVQEGVDAYHKALAQEGGDAGTYINLSYALLLQERFKEAAHAARQAVAADPKALLAHQNLASALHRMERYEDTLAALKAAAELMKQPTAEHNYHLGHIAGLLGRAEEAEGYLLEALAIDPNHQGSRRELLSAYLQAGRYDKARRAFPGLQQQLMQQAFAHYTGQRYGQALELYRHLAAIAPGSAEVHANLGSALAQTGRFRESIASFERALAINPELEAARLNLEHARARLGRGPGQGLGQEPGTKQGPEK